MAFYWTPSIKGLKLHYYKFENLPIYSISCKCNTLKFHIFNPKSSPVIYLPVSFAFSLKRRLLFNILHCFGMFFSNYFKHFGRTCLKSGRCYNVESFTYYFYMVTKILADFHICISVPLMLCNIKQFHRLSKYSLIFLPSFDI